MRSVIGRALGGRRSRRKFRNLGDIARDRSDWANAAAFYRRHLFDRPDDFAIWVQLGHALKEDKRIAIAIAAYEEALVLSPGDADLLLNLGHAYKLAGDAGAAASYYERSAASDGNLAARRELAGMGLASVITENWLAPREFAALASALRARCRGVRPIRASAVEPMSDDSLALISSDPWIEFEIKNPEALGPMALLTVLAEPVEPGDALCGQIYLNEGAGYDERFSVSFSQPEGDARIILANPAAVRSLRWDPDRRTNRIAPPALSILPIRDEAELAVILSDTGARQDPLVLEVLGRIMTTNPLADMRVDSPPVLIPIRGAIDQGYEVRHDYGLWQLATEAIGREDYRRIAQMTEEMSYKPTFSFVMPTYNTPMPLLVECIDSMLSQTYPHFELCIADDNSSDPTVVETLSAYAERDPRLKFVSRRVNGHISEASNSALELAHGEFVVLMDHDDKLPCYALFVVACYLNRHTDADILYSDEDKITPGGRRIDPYFKGDFNKYLFFGHNMVSHLGVYRRSLVERVGGFRLGLEGSQDYDLFFRCYEKSTDDRVIHIPHILYHWRQVPGSTAISADQKSYALLAAQQAINGHFERTGTPLRSIFDALPGNTAVRSAESASTSVSIIIPTRNGLDLIEPCIASILDRPQDRVEILIVDNGSDDPDMLAYLNHMAESGVVRVLRYPHPFNYSLINNFAADEAAGEVLCFLNNDTEVLSPRWIDRARAFLAMPDIGAVGARLFYPDGALQHFGIGIGMSEHGVAGLPHAGIPPGHHGYFSKAALIQEVSAVTAACLFVRASTFREIGGFEPDLRVAYNDVDLCLKIRALGLKIIVDPDTSLIHKESRSRGSDRDGENARRLDQEAAWMIDRWGETLRRDPYLSPNIDLMRGDFAYDFTPRVPFPWQRWD